MLDHKRGLGLTVSVQSETQTANVMTAYKCHDRLLKYQQMTGNKLLESLTNCLKIGRLSGQ